MGELMCNAKELKDNLYVEKNELLIIFLVFSAF